MSSGYYWHVHHDVLMAWCWDHDERWRYINEHKPVNEQSLRFRLFQPVVGELPVEVVEAGEARNKAWAGLKACPKAWNTRKAENIADKTWRIYAAASKAHDAAIALHQAEIEALHATECPDCPWDGKSIFPE